MIRRAVHTVAARAAELLSILGLAAVTWGVVMIYRPAGVIVGGVSLLIAAMAASR